MAGAEALYTAQVLRLATSLADRPFDPTLPHQGSARSPVCGSTVELGLGCDPEGRIAEIGLKVHACAIGQAAAAIFADSATGKLREELDTALAEIGVWLAGSREFPAWPGFTAIEAARGYPARHGAILLAWKAALDALPSQARPG